MSEIIYSCKLCAYPEVSKTWAEFESDLKPICFQANFWQEQWHSLLAQKGIETKVAVVKNTSGDALLLSSLAIGMSRILKIIPRKTAFLNATGIVDYDVICAEDCFPLIKPGSETKTLLCLIDSLIREQQVKEIQIGAISIKNLDSLQKICDKLGLLIEEDKRASHFWIDLESLRSKGQSHLASLSQRTRGVVRKSIESYQTQFGSLAAEYAESSQQAHAWLDQMIALNQQRLQAKQQQSSFTIPFLSEFHHTLIENTFATNQIILLRVSAGESCLGYIYGFTSHQNFYVYQSGFNFSLDEKLSPGLVSHHLVAEEVLRRGMRRYDFLAGDYQYKRSLSNDQEELVWIRLVQPSFALKTEQWIRRIKRYAKTKILTRTSHDKRN